MFTPKSTPCNASQVAVLLQITPLSQLDSEAVALLEMLSEDNLDSEEAYFRVCESRRAHCLTFISDDQAVCLMEVLKGFENGLSLEDLMMISPLSLTQ